MRRRLNALLALAALTAACAVNPATGEREISFIGEDREIEMGREGDGQVSSSLGLVEDAALQAYVDGLGKRLAATSERPNLPWSFKVVDDPVVNAFALPGGFIFVTRGILANFESEAELAGVLGHELGHVTARHSVSQMSRQQLQQIGLVAGMIVSEGVRQYGDVLMAGVGLLNLRYSRGDETEADELGVRYMARTGFDAEALVGVFRMLASVSGGGEGRVPQWQLTHPYPENREAHIREVIVASQVATGGVIDRDEFLARIDGIVYGENPREGYFKEDRFLHPDLAFEMRFPVGWATVNQRSAVGATAPGEDGLVVLALQPDADDPTLALRAFLGQEGITAGPVRENTESGIRRTRALFSARTEDGELRGEVAFLLHGGAVYRILGVAPATRWGAYAQAVGAALSSFVPLTDTAVLAVEPHRVEIVTLREAMSITQFHQRYPSPLALEEVARLNRRTPDEPVPAGTKLKQVVGRPFP